MVHLLAFRKYVGQWLEFKSKDISQFERFSLISVHLPTPERVPGETDGFKGRSTNNSVFILQEYEYLSIINFDTALLRSQIACLSRLIQPQSNDMRIDRAKVKHRERLIRIRKPNKHSPINCRIAFKRAHIRLQRRSTARPVWHQLHVL